jgi:nicotinamidase-related amidase
MWGTTFDAVAESRLAGRLRMSEHRIANSFGIHRASTALLVIDMLSDFGFPDGDAVLRSARRIAPRIWRLEARAAARRLSCIYINDNFELWRSDVTAIVAHCARTSVPTSDAASS